jgi:hypothetical protein
MPAKKGGVITVGEARKLFRDEPSMKTALHFFQFAAGDRVEDKRMRTPNQTDAARGYRYVDDDEHAEIRAIVDKLVTAIKATP